MFNTSWLDSISALPAAAVSTTRIATGTSVLNIVVRNPVVCAKALATIDILSSGQALTVGVTKLAEFPLKKDGPGFQKRWRS